MSEETANNPEMEGVEAIDVGVMDPEAIRALVQEMDVKYAEILDDQEYDASEITEMFNYINAVIFRNEWEKGARILREMKPVIDDYFNDAVSDEAETEPTTEEGEETPEPPIEKALSFLVDWHMLSLRFTPETRKDFSDIEHYRELLDAFDLAPPKFRLKEVKAKLQMIHHYNHWLARGGDIDALSDEDYDLLNDMSEEYPDELDQLLEKKRADGEWEDYIEIKRTLHKYYIYRGQVNNAIKTIKELLEVLPHKKDFTAADSGDLQMDLAKIYMNYKKWKTAKKYFKLAQQSYQKDDLEMFVMQAESWAEEAQKMLDL